MLGMHYIDTDNVVFEEHFVRRIIGFLEPEGERIHADVLDFLRHLNRTPELGIEHN